MRPPHWSYGLRCKTLLHPPHWKCSLRCQALLHHPHWKYSEMPPIRTQKITSIRTWDGVSGRNFYLYFLGTAPSLLYGKKPAGWRIGGDVWSVFGRVEEQSLNDGFLPTASGLHSWLTRVMYNQRCRFAPLWNSYVVAGVHADELYVRPPVAPGFPDWCLIMLVAVMRCHAGWCHALLSASLYFGSFLDSRCSAGGLRVQIGCILPDKYFQVF